MVVAGEGVAFGVPDRCLMSLALNVMRESAAGAVASVARKPPTKSLIATIRDAGGSGRLMSAPRT